ncbi:MAG: hypothetical protein RSG22_15530 [Comamonas sp.]
MAVELEGRIIRSVDSGNQAFINRWKKLPPNVQDEARGVLRSLFMLDLAEVPAKLHMHQLVSKDVPSVLDPHKKVRAWSLHITADDRYKASFTFEKGCIYLRTCGLHDDVDKTP